MFTLNSAGLASGQVTFQDQYSGTTVTIPPSLKSKPVFISGTNFDGSTFSSTLQTADTAQYVPFLDAMFTCANTSGSISCHKTYSFNCNYQSSLSSVLCQFDNTVSLSTFLFVWFLCYVIFKSYGYILRTCIFCCGCCAAYRKGQLIDSVKNIFVKGVDISKSGPSSITIGSHSSTIISEETVPLVEPDDPVLAID